ncbi:glycosyltransferase family 87 protein [Mucilaginibacter lacusdianchii]|uniref:glycosyltransferase family 87 protein n=1 Tax=Mucilaginibacter lacusdianchii TaxID=2684211 RepID=UPI00131BB918|nr:glycosyltransferase family 87 protein [Mucilaginibacter sp. JXJ CY 39]
MFKKIPYLNNFRLVCLLYAMVSVFCWQYKYFGNRYNNYSIFEQVYNHARAQTNLYAFYPNEYFDSNHYGPAFSIIVAPFALLPTMWGFLLWNIANAVIFIYAVRLLPINDKAKMLLLLCCSIEFANAQHAIQFNPIIAAFIIFAFVLVEKRREEWGTLFIILGTFIKLYPIAGLMFFMFSKRKKAFIAWCVVWSVVWFCAPMLISSPQFILQSYADWWHSLHDKNLQNMTLLSAQDLSVMGVLRRITSNLNVPNLPFLIAAAACLGFSLLRFSQYRYLNFRLCILSSALITVVIFSTGSEPPTYIIATAGAILYLLLQPQPYTKTTIALFIAIALFAALVSTDAIPAFIRKPYLSRYAVKVWPYIAVWGKLVYDMLFKNFNGKVYMQPQLSENNEEALLMA